MQFRKWAAGIIEEFTIKAYVMDDERIKSGGSILTEQYFEEQLQRIREIRLSERKFYQKITEQDWGSRLNRFIEATDREVLQDAGKVTAEIARAHAESECEKYRGFDKATG